MTRKTHTLVVVLLVVSASAFAPVAAAETQDPYADKLSPGVESLDAWTGYQTPDWAKTYEGGHVGFFIQYSNGSYGALEDWANASTERTIRTNDADDDRALVTAPTAHVLGGWQFSGLPSRTPGLVANSYVETIALNMEISNADPPESMNASSYTTPPASRFVPGEFGTTGIAFSGETNVSTLAGARNAMNVDNVAVNGSGITAAVIDDGYNAKNTTSPQHVNFVGAKNIRTGEMGLTNVTDSEASYHGTWTTHALAGNFSGTKYDGVAPGASVLFAKALTDSGSGSIQHVAQAVEWSEANGADVISLSLGSPRYSPVLASEMKEALRGNTTAILVAVGNSRTNPVTRWVSTPADVEKVLGVAAMNTERPQDGDNTSAESAFFSDVGPDPGTTDLSRGATAGQLPDVAAPGMSLTTKVVNENGFVENSTLSGTSMATPLAAGAVVLMLDANPDLVNDTAAVNGYVRNTSVRMPHAGVTEVGHGMIDAERLVNLNTTNQTQAEVRTADAVARDKANRGYSGSRLVRAYLTATTDELNIL